MTTLLNFSYKVLAIYLTQVTGSPDIPHKCPNLFKKLLNGTLKQHIIASCHTNLRDYNTLAVLGISINDILPLYTNQQLTLGLGSKYLPEQFFFLDTYDLASY